MVVVNREALRRKRRRQHQRRTCEVTTCSACACPDGVVESVSDIEKRAACHEERRRESL
jgi:hypothetical protein